MDIFLAAVVAGAVAVLLLNDVDRRRVVPSCRTQPRADRLRLGGTHIVTGGGRVVWPLFQSFQELSLELMSFDVAPEQQLYTSQGVAVAVEAVSQIKVKSDPMSIRTAAEQFLTKPPAEREACLRLVMEGHLRGIVACSRSKRSSRSRDRRAAGCATASPTMSAKWGLEVVSFTI